MILTFLLAAPPNCNVQQWDCVDQVLAEGAECRRTEPCVTCEARMADTGDLGKRLTACRRDYRCVCRPRLFVECLVGPYAGNTVVTICLAIETLQLTWCFPYATGLAIPPACEGVDVDFDGDVDLADYRRFQLRANCKEGG